MVPPPPSSLLSCKGAYAEQSPSALYMAQESVQCEVMDPDTLFVAVITAIIVIVFVLGVTAGCGCTFWRQRVTGGNWNTLRYEVKIIAEEIDPQRAHEGPRKKAHALASTLNLDWPYGNKDKAYPEPIRPSDVFRTKEQLQLAVAKARHAGTRPDTSRVVRRPASE